MRVNIKYLNSAEELLQQGIKENNLEILSKSADNFLIADYSGKITFDKKVIQNHPPEMYKSSMRLCADNLLRLSSDEGTEFYARKIIFCYKKIGESYTKIGRKALKYNLKKIATLSFFDAYNKEELKEKGLINELASFLDEKSLKKVLKKEYKKFKNYKLFKRLL